MSATHKTPNDPDRVKPHATRSEPPHILVLTVHIGRGHQAVAHGLRRSLVSQGAKVTIRSPIDDVPFLRRMPELYCFLTRNAPKTWERYYQMRRRPGFARRANARFVRRFLTERLLAEVGADDYEAVVVTTSLYCHCLQDLRDRVHLTVLVTDLFGGPTEWFLPGARRYIVPSDRMYHEGATQFLGDENLLTRRLPTILPRKAFQEDRADRFNVLIVGGSGGVGPIEAVATGLARSGLDAAVTVVCGTNRRLESKLHRQLGPRFEIRGFVPGLARRLNQFDFVVTKPGSATLMEILESGVPFAVMPGIPGIEDGNTSELLARSIPILRDEVAATRVIRQLFEPNGTLTLAGRKWQTNIERVRTGLPSRELKCSDVT